MVIIRDTSRVYDKCVLKSRPDCGWPDRLGPYALVVFFLHFGKTRPEPRMASKTSACGLRQVVRWSMLEHIRSLCSFGSMIRLDFSNHLNWWWRIANLRCCLGCVPSRCSIYVYSISSYVAGGYCGLQRLGWGGRM